VQIHKKRMLDDVDGDEKNMEEFLNEMQMMIIGGSCMNEYEFQICNFAVHSHVSNWNPYSNALTFQQLLLVTRQQHWLEVKCRGLKLNGLISRNARCVTLRIFVNTSSEKHFQLN
jgi:hypothetical protein